MQAAEYISGAHNSKRIIADASQLNAAVGIEHGKHMPGTICRSEELAIEIMEKQRTLSKALPRSLSLAGQTNS